MKYISGILVVVLSTMLLFSCKKDLKNNPNDKSGTVLFNNSTLDPITDFYESMYTQTAGQLVMSSFKTLAVQDEPCDPNVWHSGWDRNGQRICLKMVPGSQVNSRKRWVYVEAPCPECHYATVQTAFGETIDLEADATTFGTAYTHSIYVPTEIKFAAPSFSHDLVLENNTNISWNTDGQNPKGDVIYISYDPTSYENLELAGAEDQPMAKGIPLGNTEGEYTFTDDDLEGFPDGVHVNVTLCRYNWEINENPNTGESAFVVVGSSVMGTFTVNK